MQNGKEVKVAIIVGIIMITICLIAFVTVKSKNNLKDVKIEVYKLYEVPKEDGEKGYVYHSCGEIKTDDQITIMHEIDKAYKLNEESLLTGKQIEGYYKINYNGKIVAFDAPRDNEKMIYREDTGRLYNFESNLYETVKNICG